MGSHVSYVRDVQWKPVLYAALKTPAESSLIMLKILTPLAKSSVSPGDLQLLRKNVCSYLGNDEMDDESISLNSEILTLSQAVPISDEKNVRRKWTLANDID